MKDGAYTGLTASSTCHTKKREEQTPNNRRLREGREKEPRLNSAKPGFEAASRDYYARSSFLSSTVPKRLEAETRFEASHLLKFSLLSSYDDLKSNCLFSY
jgi:hypothetical protein